MKALLTILIVWAMHSLCFAQTNVFPDTGKVGIGTMTPRSALEIFGLKSVLSIASVKPTESMTDNEVMGGIDFYKHYALANGAAIKMLHAGGPNNYSMTHLAFYTAGGGNPYYTVPEERMRITSTGSVAIGTIDPKGYKLAVNGNIRAQEIKVETDNWPDYVFNDDYKPVSLKDLEQFIRINKHLPEMPPAKEIEANGVDLGNMNKLLLKKVEELTLHLIEKEKEISTLKEGYQRIEDLERKLNQILNKK